MVATLVSVEDGAPPAAGHGAAGDDVPAGASDASSPAPSVAYRTMLEVVLTIPFWLELAAALTGGLSGAMSAVRARYDIFGVVCIALTAGLAGGIMRDLLMQNYGIYAFQKPELLLACAGAGVIVFYFGKLATYLDPVVNLLDNLSVALWAIISVGKSMSAGMDIIPAAILGTITAVGGGICRDVCMNREPISFQAGALYGTAAFIGALVYALMNQNHVLADYAPWACVVLVLGIRYGSLFFGWHTKPPRDYTDVIARPAKAVARWCARRRARWPASASGAAPTSACAGYGACPADVPLPPVEKRGSEAAAQPDAPATPQAAPADAAPSDPSDRIHVDREELRRIMGGEDDEPATRSSRARKGRRRKRQPRSLRAGAKRPAPRAKRENNRPGWRAGAKRPAHAPGGRITAAQVGVVSQRGAPWCPRLAGSRR